MKNIFVYGGEKNKWAIEWANANSFAYENLSKEEAIEKAKKMLREKNGGLLTVIVDGKIKETYVVK